MPSKTEKQKNFFGAVMGAEKGQSKVSGKAKKVAKAMPKKEIKKFLKKEGEEDEQSCWSGYKKEGTKKKGGKTVNNCVKESVQKKVKAGGGKAVFDGPKVKERKKSAPASQTHKKKKGKGSYMRAKKQKIEENNKISDFVDAIIEKRYNDADKYLKDVVEHKLQVKIAELHNTPMFT